MRIGGSGSSDVNLLQSDAAQFRNEDFVVAQGGAFMGRLGQVAVAAEYSYSQIFNPAASGVVLLVDGVYMAANATSNLVLAIYNTKLTGAEVAWANQLIGGSAGNGLVAVDSNAAALGAAFGSSYVLANTVWPFRFQYPPQLGEGEGLIVYSATVNVGVMGTWWGREV